MRGLTARILALLFFIHPASADTVVLRDGETLEGTIANKEQIREDPLQVRAIALLLVDGSSLQRYAVGDVAYVSFRGNPPEVIDFATLEPIADQGIPSQESNGWSRTGLKRKGAVSTIFGSALLIVGLTVPLGTDRTTLPSGETLEEDVIGGLNYALIAGGVLLSAYGVSVLVQSSKQEAFGLRFAPARAGVRVAVCYICGF